MKITRKAALAAALRGQRLTDKTDDVVEAVRDCMGIYATSPVSHFSLAARVKDYTSAMLNQATVAQELLRVPAIRGALQLMPKDLVPAAIALAGSKWIHSHLRKLGYDRDRYDRIADRIEEMLSEGPLRLADIRERLGPAGPGTAMSPFLRAMSHDGRIYRAPLTGASDRSMNIEYARLSEVLEMPAPLPSREECLPLFVPQWMRVQGPVTIADLMWWANATKTEARACFQKLGAVEVEFEGSKEKAFILPGTRKLYAAPRKKDDSVKLLPYWDTYLMGHKDRSRYLPDELKPHIVDKIGNVTNVILAGGEVTGLWDLEDTTLHVAFLGQKIPSAKIKAAAQDFKRVFPVEEIKIVKPPKPLAKRNMGVFIAPLREKNRK